MTLPELHERRVLLETRKRELKAEQFKILSELASVDAQCCDKLPIAEYKALQKRRFELKSELYNSDINFAALNQDYADVAEKIRTTKIELAPKVQSEDLKTVVARLVALRAHYQEFSADHSRVQSMKTMAAEFAMKIDGIIKGAINQ